MTRAHHEIGEYVTHPARPEWGPGRVLDVRGSDVTVYFRDVPGDDPLDAVKTIRVNAVALATAELTHDAILDNLPPYKDGGFQRLPRKRVTLNQGIARFHASFPLYFDDPEYFEKERAYKWSAHELFNETLGKGQLGHLLSSTQVDDARRRALAVEGRVNLLAVFEKAAFRDGLRDDRAAERLLKALDDLLRPATVEREAFEVYIGAINALPSTEGKTDPAKWTVATVLPYLAEPSRFMFLKPTVTQDCAARLTFDLKYTPDLNWTTYSKLLEMSNYLLGLLKPYGARDFIDVQSFIWVVGHY